MHLWPSATIRDSFKLAYLRKLEWNLQRMKREKESNSANQKLLGRDGQEGVVKRSNSNSQEGGGNGKVVESPSSEARGEGLVLGICRETLMLLSCCFCCFCCGACADKEVDPIF